MNAALEFVLTALDLLWLLYAASAGLKEDAICSKALTFLRTI